MSHKTFPCIAIIGAGPGGLTLARLLHMQGHTPIIFEKEALPAARIQGGSLDLHPDSGLRAVHLAGLDTPFQAIARYQDQGLRIFDKMGVLHLEDNDDARPEVDRIELRAMLLDALAPASIQWGHPLDRVRPVGDGTHALVFADGQTEAFDLVVGADGAWSRVRPLLSQATPMYTGVTYIELGIDDVDRQHPNIARLIGRGTMLAVAEHTELITQRNARGHIRVYVILREHEEELRALSRTVAHPEQARARLLGLFQGWSPGLREIIDICTGNVAIRPLYTLPVGHSWDAHSGVTLLGDAAHLMPPSAGQGVNQAMQDAVELAEAISTHSSLAEAVRAYEQCMFVRAKRAAELSAAGLNRRGGKDALADTLAYFRQFTPA